MNAWKLWNFSMKAAPKAGVSVAHTWTKQQNCDAKNAESVKSATKLSMKHGDANVTVTAANDKYAVAVAGPLNKDDWAVDGSFSWEDKIGKQRKVVVGAEVESPDMSGTKLKANVGVEVVMKPEKEGKAQDPENKVTFDACVCHDKKSMFGVAIEHDTKELSAAEVGLAHKEGDNKYWGGYDHANGFAKFGCLINYKEKNFKHAYEARYALKDADGKQFMGQAVPLTVVGGGNYKLSDATTMNYMVEMGADAHAMAKFSHKVDKNWAVSGFQSYDKNAKDGRQPYVVGFDVAYTL